jgi:hypothetical protein
MFATKRTNTQPVNAANPPNLRTYNAWGVQQAGHVDGSSDALLPCLQSVYVNIRKKIEQNEEVQNVRRTEIAGNICDLEAQNNVINTKLQNEEKKLTYEEGKIERLKKEIDDIKQNPNQITGDKFVKASFWIGLTIIVFLTIYLFVFYSSAAYSAFFKNFKPDDINVVNSIFDSQALSKAFSDGFSELILILTIPAVFLGLGFLIHKFQEQKKVISYFKIVGLILTTFVFDVILAYEIVEKIYNILKDGSFNDMPPMTVSMAFEQINFWLIIFAGFVVYLIWGFVFDFVMNEYAKLDRVRYAIKSKEKRIADYKKTCKEIKSVMQELQTQKSILDGKINKLKT